MAVVFIPPLLRRMTGGIEQVTVPGRSLRQVVNGLEEQFPGIKGRLIQDDDLMPGISAAVDGEVARLGLMEPVQDTSEVHFLPAISGG